MTTTSGFLRGKSWQVINQRMIRNIKKLYFKNSPCLSNVPGVTLNCFPRFSHHWGSKNSLICVSLRWWKTSQRNLVKTNFSVHSRRHTMISDHNIELKSSGLSNKGSQSKSAIFIQGRKWKTILGFSSDVVYNGANGLSISFSIFE